MPTRNLMPIGFIHRRTDAGAIIILNSPRNPAPSNSAPPSPSGDTAVADSLPPKSGVP